MTRWHCHLALGIMTNHENHKDNQVLHHTWQIQPQLQNKDALKTSTQVVPCKRTRRAPCNRECLANQRGIRPWQRRGDSEAASSSARTPGGFASSVPCRWSRASSPAPAIEGARSRLGLRSSSFGLWSMSPLSVAESPSSITCEGTRTETLTSTVDSVTRSELRWLRVRTVVGVRIGEALSGKAEHMPWNHKHLHCIPRRNLHHTFTRMRCFGPQPNALLLRNFHT